MTLAACSSALEGMQPTLRQTPPSIGQRSTSVTLRPRSAARNAAVYPPGPAPRTNNWVSRSCGTSGLSGFDGFGAGAGAGAARGAETAEGAGAFAAGAAAAGALAGAA